MNNKIACILIVLLLLSICASFAAEQAKIRIAVLPFKLGQTKAWWGWEWDPGTGISDMVVTDLVNTGRFSVYERERLEEILSEQKLGVSGLVDTSTAVSIGKLLGVQLLLMGTVTRFDLEEKKVKVPFLGEVGEATATVQLDLRLVDAQSGEIISALRGDGQEKSRNLSLGSLFGALHGLSFKSSDFQNTILGKATTTAVGQVVNQLLEKTQGMEAKSIATRSISGQVADVTGKEVTLNVGKQHKVQVGDLFRVQRKTREIKDPTSGAVIRVVYEQIGQVKITEVFDGASVGEIVQTESGKSVTVGDVVELSQ